MQEHGATMQGIRRRTIQVANLDPAADAYAYDATFDIRELINVSEVMEEIGLGPNGGLLYCMEYLLENMDWLHTQIETNVQDDDYLLLDCPGQIELYTHVPVMRRIIDSLRLWGYGDTSVAVFCLDATFLTETSKFISGSLLSLSAMLAMELPHINVLTKCDLMNADQIESILDYGSASQLWDLDQDRHSIIPASADEWEDVVDYYATNKFKDITSNVDNQEQTMTVEQQEQQKQLRTLEQRRRKRGKLTDAICSLLDDYQMVSFVPLDRSNEDSIDHVLATVDHAIQYGEDLDVRGAHDDNDFQHNQDHDD
jgi:GPN-loop GTPase